MSRNDELKRNQKEMERLKEFREEIEDIDVKYPKGDVDDVDMIERGIVDGFNADGYHIK